MADSSKKKSSAKKKASSKKGDANATQEGSGGLGQKPVSDTGDQATGAESPYAE